jgi:hypothetical protein
MRMLRERCIDGEPSQQLGVKIHSAGGSANTATGVDRRRRICFSLSARPKQSCSRAPGAEPRRVGKKCLARNFSGLSETRAFQTLAEQSSELRQSARAGSCSAHASPQSALPAERFFLCIPAKQINNTVIRNKIASFICELRLRRMIPRHESQIQNRKKPHRSSPVSAQERKRMIGCRRRSLFLSARTQAQMLASPLTKQNRSLLQFRIPQLRPASPQLRTHCTGSRGTVNDSARLRHSHDCPPSCGAERAVHCRL